jgi:predicted Zn finger-like uncharacterized protein
MKFLCDSCGTKYAISDERVRGRVLKIRCKKCDFVITVREDVQAVASSVPSDAEIGRAFDAQRASRQASSYDAEDKTTIGGLDDSRGGENSDWYVSFDGEQEGPFDLKRAIDRVRQEQGTDKEAHAWRPGFLVWLPVEEVPELAPALLSRPMRAPVRASTPTPIGTGRTSGSVKAQIPKDPSGPRAALAVSAGTRPAPRSEARPEGRSTPGIAEPLGKPTGLPSRSGASTSLAAAPAAAPAPMFPASNPPTLDPDALIPDDEPSAPDLPISAEASGLVNIAHIGAAAFGDKNAGPVMLNGHTAGHPRFKSGRQRAIPEPITALEPSEPKAGTAPVVVVAGTAPSGTHPLFKWAALVAIVACIGLGGGVWYLLTHRPAPDTIIVTEHARRADDAPITVTDPASSKATVADPKKIASAPKKGGPPRPGVAPVAAKAGDGLSGSQRALADLYKDDGDKATPHLTPGMAGSHAGGGGPVSQPAILAVVTANRRALNLCYERVLKHDQSLKQGRVVVQVTVGISGRVTSVTIPDAQYATSELGQCFTQAVKRWNFPASDSSYSTEFPFILQGQ